MDLGDRTTQGAVVEAHSERPFLRDKSRHSDEATIRVPFFWFVFLGKQENERPAVATAYLTY
ncbi:MAG: hypothetical protein KTR16_01010 [Acidiferrobacterales bacterium]|nr:hypothetical protein [Acidiferrobacterales bacterium]